MVKRGQGSGFIVSSDGVVLTNAHVVADAGEVSVKLTDRREFRAKVVGLDRPTDIAVLKIDAQDLPTVRIGDPERTRVGEWVLAIGSPFGFENSVTAGIVSAKSRSLPAEGYVPFIQTDVAINPGNSGGPLFNRAGEVIGVNSQIYSRSGGYQGLSFAIPIDVANDVANQLRTQGKVTRGKIGVVIQPLTKDLADSFGLPKPAGALVNSVEKGGPAERGGVEPGDVITRFDGKPVNSSEDLPRLVAGTRPGAKVNVQVWRNKGSKDLQVVVGEMQDEARTARAAPRRGGEKPAPGAGTTASRYGMTVSDLSPQQREQMKLAGGILVDEAQGAAARAGIRRGDVIMAVNNQDVKSVEQFLQVMGQFEKGKIVSLLVRRGANSQFFALKVE
jgi:serine protease Do